MNRREQAELKRSLVLKEAAEFGLTNIRIEQPTGRKAYIVADTPSTLEYRTELRRWLKGNRPPAGYMRDVKTELAEIGLTLVRFEKVLVGIQKPVPHMFMVSQNQWGVEWKCSLANWASGAAKPFKIVFRNIPLEMNEYGLNYLGSTRESVRGSMTTMHHVEMFDGSPKSIKEQDWLIGHRPDKKGPYDPKLVERDARFSEMPVKLYYVRLQRADDEDPAYKIGITKNEVLNRLHAHKAAGYNISPIRVWEMSALSASRIEDTIKRRYAKWRVKVPSNYPSGHTETFYRDVLELDIQAN